MILPWVRKKHLNNHEIIMIYTSRGSKNPISHNSYKVIHHVKQRLFQIAPKASGCLPFRVPKNKTRSKGRSMLREEQSNLHEGTRPVELMIPVEFLAVSSLTGCPKYPKIHGSFGFGSYLVGSRILLCKNDQGDMSHLNRLGEVSECFRSFLDSSDIL